MKTCLNTTVFKLCEGFRSIAPRSHITIQSVATASQRGSQGKPGVISLRIESLRIKRYVLKVYVLKACVLSTTCSKHVY